MLDQVGQGTKTNLLNFDLNGLAAWFKELGEPAFKAKQLFKWMHFRGVTRFEEMSDISKALRQKLSDIAEIKPPKIVLDKPSSDGTHKWLLEMPSGGCIETVYIPEPGRGTLCVSSQIGCMLTCTFCSTGTQGFQRNLTIAEIIGQLWIATRQLSKNNGEHDRKVTNIVMMGMGEPLLNFDNVISAMSIMLDDYAYGLSRRRVTLSTSGVVPEMDNLAKTLPVSLAVSLHAPTDELRNQIVPINRKYPLSELMRACRDYVQVDPHKTITFEYVMLQEINDSIEHAEQLVALLHNVPCKMNLIPFNPFPGTQYQCSSNNRIHRFQRYLQEHKIMTTIRKTRGDDIDAACGQLVGQVKDRTSRQRKHNQKLQQTVLV